MSIIRRWQENSCLLNLHQYINDRPERKAPAGLLILVRQKYLFQQRDRARDEGAEVFAFEEAVGQEGEVDELLDEGLAGGVVADGFFLLFAAVSDFFLEVFDFLVALGVAAGLVGLAELADLGVVGLNFVSKGLYSSLERFGGFVPDAGDEWMLGVDDEVVAVGQFAIEGHAGLKSRHLFHAPHIFVLSDDYGLVARCHCLERDEKLGFLDFRSLRAEHSRHDVALQRGEVGGLAVVFADKVVDDVRVDADEGRLPELALEHTDEMAVELSVEDEHVVAAVVGRLDEVILGDRVGGIEIDDVAVFVGLVGFDEYLIFVEGEIFALGVFEKHELHGRLTEFLVGQHTVDDKELDVVPFLLKSGAVGLEEVFETRCDFLCYI